MARKKPPATGPFRETGDKLVKIPLGQLDEFPGNPKTPIFGKYRRGLEESLDHFGIRDTLKVYPNPREVGRYFVLDGNQRLPLLIEAAEKAHGVDLDSGDDGVQDRSRRMAALAIHIECRILELSPDDAKRFNAAFNRNHAKYDELKLSEIHEDLISRLKEQGDEARTKLKRLLRPEPAPLVQPILDAADSLADSEQTEPSEDEPWGPPPNPPAPRGAVGGNPPARRSVVFSFSPEGHDEIMQGILRAKDRALRESRIRAAVASFDQRVFDSALLEMMLRCLGTRAGLPENE